MSHPFIGCQRVGTTHYGMSQTKIFKLNTDTGFQVIHAFTGAPNDGDLGRGVPTLANGVYYLSFPNGNYFGYYSYLTDPHYIFHFDLGYEY